MFECKFKSNPAGKKMKIKCKKYGLTNCVGEENCDYAKEQDNIIKRQIKKASS